MLIGDTSERDPLYAPSKFDGPVVDLPRKDGRFTITTYLTISQVRPCAVTTGED